MTSNIALRLRMIVLSESGSLSCIKPGKAEPALDLSQTAPHRDS